MRRAVANTGPVTLTKLSLFSANSQKIAEAVEKVEPLI